MSIIAKELVNKRLLIVEKNSSFKYPEEVKVIEASPSGNYVRIINSRGVDHWKPISEFKVIEELLLVESDKKHKVSKVEEQLEATYNGCNTSIVSIGQANQESIEVCEIYTGSEEFEQEGYLKQVLISQKQENFYKQIISIEPEQIASLIKTLSNIHNHWFSRKP